MSSFLAPNTRSNAASAIISRLFEGFWRLWLLMYSQIRFVISVRGSGSDPTIWASSGEGRIGFIKAGLSFFSVFVVIIPAAQVSLRQSACVGRLLNVRPRAHLDASVLTCFPD